MKKMNWTKLSNNELAKSPNSIWAKLQKEKRDGTNNSNCNSPMSAAPQSPQPVGIDFAQLESKFNMETNKGNTKFERKLTGPQTENTFALLDAKRTMHGARFRQKFTLEDAIGFHACWLEARACV
jgi:hypothetical protein